MIRLLYIALPLLMVMALPACGNKGKLKTPNQMAQEEAEKEAKAAKKAAEEE